MRDYIVRGKDGYYLSLIGPFEYASWRFHPEDAALLTRGKAHRLADYFGGDALHVPTQETPCPPTL